jgi:hypothetical protein
VDLLSLLLLKKLLALRGAPVESAFNPKSLNLQIAASHTSSSPLLIVFDEEAAFEVFGANFDAFDGSCFEAAFLDFFIEASTIAQQPVAGLCVFNS